MTILLGSVALEPNRWGQVDPRRRATISLAGWLPSILDAGFDGVEIWEDHLDDAVQAADLGLTFLNTYVSFDDPDDGRREAVADRARSAQASAVKFNVGTDPSRTPDYAARIARWCDALPATTRALCECHAGTCADDPMVAARLFDAAGPPDRVGAIVHTHESDDHLRERFDAYGDRITHVHVNHLDGSLAAPRLRDVRDRVAAKAALLGDLGFRGSWTIEFVHGTSTVDDRVELLVAAAVDDLHVLADVLGGSAP